MHACARGCTASTMLQPVPCTQQPAILGPCTAYSRARAYGRSLVGTAHSYPPPTHPPNHPPTHTTQHDTYPTPCPRACRTYSTLVSSAKGRKSRLQQVVDWVGGPGFEGVICFDECECAGPPEARKRECQRVGGAQA